MKRGIIPRVCNTLPTQPGLYYWTEWKAKVNVIKRGRTLFVTPPCKGAVEIKVTPNIAGDFLVVV